MKLNLQQEQAANHVDGPCLVVAVPGSGKTRLLVERMGRLVESGIPQKNIVCMTFTNKAADEMRSRICERLGVNSPRAYVGTFHKLCVKLLRRFGDNIGYSPNFTVVDSDDQKELVKQAARRLDVTLERKDIFAICKAVNDFRENQWDRDKMEDALEEGDFIAVADLYFEQLKKSNSIDFSGLLSESIILLREHPDILERVQTVMKYIQVDEVQDTNFAQFELIKMFMGKWKNILMVGDVSQSIYRFRGARYQNIRDFLDDNSNCQLIELPLNYRSTPEIVAAADSLIRHNSSHMAEEFVTDNSSGEEVKCLAFSDQMREAEFVASHTKRMIEEGGWAPGDIAILYRTNAMSQSIEQSMANAQVAYQVIGGRSFYDRKEIKDCLALLKIVANPKDCIAFSRLCKIIPGIGDKTIGAIESMSLKDSIPIHVAAANYAGSVKRTNIRKSIDTITSRLSKDYSNMTTRDCLETLVVKFEVESHLISEFGEENGAERMDNVNQLISSAGEFDRENQDASVSSYLQALSLMSSADEKDEQERVSLMTLHASKGLEFPVIFVVGVEEKLLPHTLSLSEDEFDRTEEGLEEERRLCYVGMTRAEKLLIMTFCRGRRQYGRGGQTWVKPAKPSRFLLEAKLLEKE
jgi:DNA helicase II / ATP-dependent DNA helicase PcrA